MYVIFSVLISCETVTTTQPESQDQSSDIPEEGDKKEEEPKPEEPKQEESKQEKSKQEEPKQEEPKLEEPKQEEPKQDGDTEPEEDVTPQTEGEEQK